MTCDRKYSQLPSSQKNFCEVTCFQAGLACDMKQATRGDHTTKIFFCKTMFTMTLLHRKHKVTCVTSIMTRA